MNDPAIAIWVFGPLGSGKSHFIRQHIPPKFKRVDQDDELERRMALHGLPFDTRTHSVEQAQAFRRLRAEVAADLWSQVPQWQAERIPLVFETTGDKPDLFREALDASRSAGYRNLGIALTVSLDECRKRNERRRRVLSDRTLVDNWNAFNHYLSKGTYQNLFEAEDLRFVMDVPGFRLEPCW